MQRIKKRHDVKRDLGDVNHLKLRGKLPFTTITHTHWRDYAETTRNLLYPAKWRENFGIEGFRISSERVM